MTPEVRNQIVEAWDAAWDAGDTGPLAELLSPDYRRITASAEDGETREQFLASIVSTRAAFPDIVTTIDQIVIEGDQVAIRWHSAGTHLHGFLGVPPTHRRVEVSGATFAELQDGQIVREHVTWDPRALLSALGIITVGQD